MKIFNWMHKRFHQSALKDGLARNVKKAESITNEADKQSLLKQVALVDVLDGWKDGILTIGTLGLDPLKPFNQHNEYFVLESEEDDDDDDDDDDYDDDEIDSNVDEEDVQEPFSVDSDDEHDEVSSFKEREEENPLMFTRFDHRFEDFGSTSDGIMTVDPRENEVQRKKKGERITLAELFLADSEMKKKTDSVEIGPNLSQKPSLRTMNGLSFAKKFITHVGDHSRPIKKIHQMMRRMLKRKIHPELEGKGYKTENQSKNGIVEVGISKGNELITESVYLLPTHAAPGPTI